MKLTMMVWSLAAGVLISLTACNQPGPAVTPTDSRTEVKVKVDEDGSKRTTKETTVYQNPDGTKTETTKKTEVKTEVHDGKIIDLPGIEVRKKP